MNKTISPKPLSKPKQWFSAIVVSLGGVGFGLSLSWTATALPNIQETQQIGHDLNTTEKSLIASLLTVGALIACPLTAAGMNIFGRKPCIIWLSILGIPGWLMLAAGSTSLHLYAGRILTGVYAGGCTIVVPVYVKELSSPENRGLLGTFFLIMLCIGKLVSNGLGILLPASMASLLCALQPLIHGLLLLAIPESPMYEIKSKVTKAKTSDADKGSIGNGNPVSLDTTGRACNDQVEANEQRLNDKRLALADVSVPIITVFVLILLAQICGINVVTFFTNEMLEGESFSSLIDPKLALVLMSAIQVIGCLPASLLVDKCGRKWLLISSFIAMTVSMGILAAYYCHNLNQNSSKMMALIPLTSLTLYNLAYSWGVGSIIWIIISEIIPSEIIHIISPLANAVFWSAAFLITFLFQLFSANVPLYIWFFAFSLVSVGGAVFVALLLPETKGLTVEEIQKIYQKRLLYTQTQHTYSSTSL